MQKVKNTTQTTCDCCSIGLAVICIIHCLAFPLLLSVLPSLEGSLDGHFIHRIWVFLAILFSFVAIYFGYAKHRNKKILSTAIVGLVALIVAAWLGHDLLGEMGEKVMTILGGCLLVAAHIGNFVQARKNN